MSTATETPRVFARLGRSAADLAELGYDVFPVAPRAKRPLTETGFKAATRDARQIEAWWRRWPNANIGIACGQSGIVVFDIDTKHGADPREILARHDRAGAPVVGTGIAAERSERHPRSLAGRRGVQVYFAGDMASTPRLKIPGVEIKARRGYVVAPPSIHPSGIEYAGQLPPAEELPPVPRWLTELVQRPPRRPPARRPPRLPSQDRLLGITAEEFIPRLTGREIGRDRKVQCPFHAGGRERTPSLHVYPGAGGWYCWPCGVGGGIYDFGALLFGLEPRGAAFLELRRRLTEDLLGAVAA